MVADGNRAVFLVCVARGVEGEALDTARRLQVEGLSEGGE